MTNYCGEQTNYFPPEQQTFTFLITSHNFGLRKRGESHFNVNVATLHALSPTVRFAER